MTGVVTELNPHIGKIAKLINAEFDEMPGLRLTEAQVRRLWSLSPGDSQDALDCLCASGQLAHDSSGRYLLRRFVQGSDVCDPLTYSRRQR